MQQPQTQLDDPQLQRLYEEPHTARERHLGLMLRKPERQPGAWSQEPGASPATSPTVEDNDGR